MNSKAVHGRASEILVLLSGGIDSCASVDFYRSMGRGLCALHVDYGQRAEVEEWRAAQQVARFYGLPLERRGLAAAALKSPGEISGRNLFLIVTAVMERPSTVSAVALGIHAGTGYVDCSVEFVNRLNGLLGMERNPVEVVAPFLDWSKADVLRYCEERQVPVHLTYSCEAGVSPPCGQCLSCLDRQVVDARA